VCAAHYILGPFGPPSDLREQGLHLLAHGGRGAKNKAAVAAARKLAVLMHALWQSGSDSTSHNGAVQSDAEHKQRHAPSPSRLSQRIASSHFL
jgi:hypothetical protein